MRTLIAWLGRGISSLFFYGPQGLRIFFGNLLAFLWFDVFRIRRQVALDNIARAFPDLNERERVRLARRSIQNLGLGFVEYSFFPWLTRDNFRDYFLFENQQLLEEKYAEGKGILLLTLHMGNGDLACAGMSLNGWPTVMVSKTFKVKWLNDLWFGMRERLGTRFIPPRDSSYALLKALKQGAAVVIPLDQFTGPPIGVRTTFFGHETGTAAGLAVMAERSGAPVLAVYTHRDAAGRHVLHFEREIKVPKNSLKDPEQARRITQEFNDQLEVFVRRHPEQWMWIHKRWKRFVVH